MSLHENVTQVKELHKEAILAKSNVVGTGIGYKVRGRRTTDELCVVVLVRQKLPEAGLAPEGLVSPEIDGVRTDVVQVGDIRALQDPTDRWRPAPSTRRSEPGSLSGHSWHLWGCSTGCGN